nr:hypothetical protein [Tanacetum cinerariifolium]
LHDVTDYYHFVVSTFHVKIVKIRQPSFWNIYYNYLSDKVTALKNKLKMTKAVYNKALITLTKRVKKLKKKLKHKRRRAVVDSSEDEEASLDKKDSPKQGRIIEEINEDENVNFVKSSKQGEAHKIAGHKMESDDTKVVDFSTGYSDVEELKVIRLSPYELDYGSINVKIMVVLAADEAGSI